jgi:hypothetical protein
MILHFSHIGLTDGRTFMCPFGRDPSDVALEAVAASATATRMKQKSRAAGAGRSERDQGA